jgi:protein gp37
MGGEDSEWAMWSWNPVTGCLHGCGYCYARDIATRVYPYGFQPAYIPEHLDMPANTEQGEPREEDDISYRNVLTCSMADLFGEWMPEEWVRSVIQVAIDNPQWTFIYLTKFPKRMPGFSYPSNVWLGATVNKQRDVKPTERAFKQIKDNGFDGLCWLSCEPLLDRLTFSDLQLFNWIVMGGSSQSRQTPALFPPFDDIVHLYQQARTTGCKIYMKTNLGIKQGITEFPTLRHEQEAGLL